MTQHPVRQNAGRSGGQQLSGEVDDLFARKLAPVMSSK